MEPGLPCSLIRGVCLRVDATCDSCQIFQNRCNPVMPTRRYKRWSLLNRCDYGDVAIHRLRLNRNRARWHFVVPRSDGYTRRNVTVPLK